MPTSDKMPSKRSSTETAMFQTLAAKAPQGIIVLQGNKVLYVNEALAKLIGYPLQEVCNWEPQDFMDIVFSEDRADASRRLKTAIAGEVKTKFYEVRIEDKTGRIRWLQAIPKLIDIQGESAILVMLVDITDRKQAEIALQESETRYHTLFDSTPVGIFSSTYDGQILDANPAFRHILGISNEDSLEAYNAVDFYVDPNIRKLLLNRLETEGVVQGFEVQFRRINGGPIWVRINSHTIRDANGNLLRFEGTLEDITERKRAEEAYRQLVEESLQGLLIIQDGRIVFSNQAFAEISGYTVEELLALSPEEVQASVHPDYQARVWGRLSDRLAGKSVPSHYHFPAIRKDGSVRWLELFATVIDYQGKPAVQATFIDITESRTAEAALQESEARYRTLFDDVPVALYRTTSDGRIVDANPALVELLGARDRDALKEISTADFYVDPEVRQEWQDLLDQGAVVQGHEVQFRRLDGNLIWVRDSFRAIRDEDGRIIYYEGSLEDITERKQAEQALKESEAKYRILVEQSLQGLIIFQDGRVVFANSQILDFLGYTLEDIIELSPETVWEFIDAEDQELMQQRLQQRLAGKPVSDRTDVRIRAKDGTLHWLDVRVHLIDYQGNPALQATMVDITERKRAEQALREREQRYRALFENTSDAVFIISLDLSNLDANQQAADFLGYTIDELRGMPVFKVVAEGEYADSERVQKALLAGEHVPVYERIFRRKDGVEVPVEVNAALVTDAEGNPLHIQSVVRDITERKIAEEELRESEERFRSVVETSHSGVLIVDENYRFVYVNEELCRILGYPREEIIGHDFREFLDEESKNLVADRYVRRQKGEDVPPRYEFNIVRKDGEKRRVEISVTVISDSQGNVRTVAQILDITERKQSEEALRESEAKYRTLVETSPDAITLTDLEGTIIMANQQALRLYGVEHEEDIIGKSAFELIAPFDIPLAMENLQKTLKEGSVGPLEYTLLRADGTPYPAELNAALLVDAEGNPHAFIGVIRDISERKEAEVQYQSLFTSVPVGLYRTTLDGQIVDANPALVQLLGFEDRESFLKRTASSFYVDPQARKQLEALIAKHGVVRGFQVQLRRNDGQLIWVELNVRAILDSKGEVQYLEGTFEDITSRKRGDAALRESEAKYRVLVEQSLQGIVISQGDPIHIVFANPAFAEMTGHTVEELLTLSPQKVQDLVHPADQKLVWERVRNRLAGQPEPQRYEYRLLQRNKAVCWVETFASRIEYNGEPAIQSTIVDITERKQAEAALCESEEKFRVLVEEISDWVWTIDNQGRFTYTNNAVEDILGYSAGQIVGQTPFDFILPEDVSRARDTFTELMERKRPIRTLVIRFQHRDGSSVMLEARGRPILNEEGKLEGFRGIFRDITDRLKMLEQLRELQDQL